MDALPDETTILKFRHLLEEHDLGEELKAAIDGCLESRGLSLREGTVVDASIVEAPSSTKNRSGERDPEMRQTKKGNQWYFGMKMHVGSDAETGIAHSFVATGANESDVVHAHSLLHGGEKQAWGDSGYQGVEKREENRGRDVDWQVAMRPGKRRQLDRRQRRGAAGEGEGVDPREVGAPVLLREADVRVCQGALPGPAQEQAADRAAARLRQSADRRAEPGGVSAAPVRPKGGESARNGRREAANRVRCGIRAPKNARRNPRLANFPPIATRSDLP